MNTITKLQQACKLFRYQNEIDCMKQNKQEDADRIKILSERVTKVQKQIKDAEQNSSTKQSVDEKKSNELFDGLRNCIYKKPWARLPEFHKIVKVKEYVLSLKIQDKKQKQQLYDNLVKGIKEKKLTKKNNVVYDSDKGIITQINCVKFNEDKKIYEII